MYLELTTTSTHSITAISAQPPSPKLASTPLINDKRIRQRAEAFSWGYDVRAWLTTGGPVPVAMGIRPPRAPEAEKSAAEALQLLLSDGRLLACFLETRDMKSLSQCCTAWRPVVGQITVLCPRPTHQWGSRWANLLQHRLTNAYELLRDPCAHDISGRATKAHVARWDRQQAEWNHVLAALERGTMPHPKTLDMQIEFNNCLFTPRLRSDSIVRLASSLSRMPHLLHLDLAGHGIGCRGATALAEALQHTPHLKYLNLSGNLMRDAGMVAIAGSFSNIPKLEYLGVVGMNAELAGMSALAANLKYLPLLQNFAFNTVKPLCGALIIPQLATDLPMLRFLTMSGSVYPVDATLLGIQIGRLANLEFFDLRLSRLSARAVTDLVEAANEGRGMPAHVRICERVSFSCESWKTEMLTHGLPEEKRTTILSNSPHMSPVGHVLEFSLPFAKASKHDDKWISKKNWGYNH